MNKKCTCQQYKYCYIRGPKGKDGSSTIEVGKTTTLYPFQDASVKNVGTKENAILEFAIPRGKDGDKITIGKTETLDANARARVVDNYVNNIHTLDFYIPQGFDGADGDVGPKGDMGPKGDTGESEKITVVETRTIDPGSNASVTDNFTNNTHNLTFSIPKGDKGNDGIGEKVNISETRTINPGLNASVTDDFSNNTHNLTFLIPRGNTGPAGPPGSKGDTGSAILEAYASLYENNGNSYTLTANIPNQVELGSISASKEVDTSFTNTIKINKQGMYKIDYYFSGQTTNNADISLELRKENRTINGSKITKQVSTAEYVSFNGSIIVSLNINDKIDMAVSSSTNITLTPGEDTISYLNILKIE